jgi:putative ABC transport system permease protein
VKKLHILFSLKFLWRNWRGGEVKILAVSLVLAVAVVTAIAVFANRMDQSLARQSNSYLGADRVVESRFGLPVDWAKQPASYNLQQTQIAEFSSMVFAAVNSVNVDGSNASNQNSIEPSEEMQLASVKAVGAAYPLRGKLEISNKAFALGEDITPASGVPPSGEVWVDSRLLPLMNINLGDSLAIGNRNFTLSQVVIREPDSTNGFALLGPRVMMNIADLESTGVILPGSRVMYKWLVAGEENDLQQFERWLKPELGEHYRLVSLKDAQQNIGTALNRGTSFLMLAGIIGVLLAGVAISTASQQFARRHIDQVALLKSLGASRFQNRQIYFAQLLFLGLIAAVIGVALGEVLQRLIAASLTSLFKVELLGASLAAYSTGIATGLLCLLCFALPPLWHLPSVSPLKVIRRELEMSHVKTWARALLGAVAVVLLIWIYSGDYKLTLAVVGGLLAIVIIGGLSALLLLRVGYQLGAKAGSIWRLALSNLRRYQNQSVTQIMVFACALMLLMVLFAVRTSLIDEWRLQLPKDAPNHFILNIAPYEKQEVEVLFSDSNFKQSPMYPMVLGRLVGVNDYIYGDNDRDRSNALRRELNLSWAEALAPDNKLIAGQWWVQWQEKKQAKNSTTNTTAVGVSVEQDTAEELGLVLGDIVKFSLGGLELKAEIASIRKVDWSAMTPNFYFLFSPGALDNYSPNYLTSLYLPAEDKQFVNQLLRDYPTIVVLEIDRIIERIRAIVEQVSRGIELVLWMVLISGVMVLIAAVNASMASRLQEAGLLRALGSSRRLILGSICFEFSTLGFFAGILAVFGAEALLLGLQVFVFEQAISPHYMLWLIGPILGALFIGLLGLFSCRSIVSVPPSVVLRQLEG